MMSRTLFSSFLHCLLLCHGDYSSVRPIGAVPSQVHHTTYNTVLTGEPCTRRCGRFLCFFPSFFSSLLFAGYTTFPIHPPSRVVYSVIFASVWCARYAGRALLGNFHAQKRSPIYDEPRLHSLPPHFSSTSPPSTSPPSLQPSATLGITKGCAHT